MYAVRNESISQSKICKKTLFCVVFSQWKSTDTKYEIEILLARAWENNIESYGSKVHII